MLPPVSSRRVRACWSSTRRTCVSDWGHDFRPDYRRIQGRAGRPARRDVAVLGTTATANDPRGSPTVSEQFKNRPATPRTSSSTAGRWARASAAVGGSSSCRAPRTALAWAVDPGLAPAPRLRDRLLPDQARHRDRRRVAQQARGLLRRPSPYSGEGRRRGTASRPEARLLRNDGQGGWSPPRRAGDGLRQSPTSATSVHYPGAVRRPHRLTTQQVRPRAGPLVPRRGGTRRPCCGGHEDRPHPGLLHRGIRRFPAARRWSSRGARRAWPRRRSPGLAGGGSPPRRCA